jgi:hypothetical protein
VFVHQFRLMAARVAPPVFRERFPTLPVYCYRHRFGIPAPGLAVVKHARAEEARERALEAARRNALVLLRPRRRPIENEVSKVGRMSREELRLAVRARFIAGRKVQQPMTLPELFQWHLANGTAHIFLASLKNG